MKLNSGDVKKTVLWVVKYNLPTGFVAGQFGASRRSVQQLVREYMETGRIPVLKQP